MSPRSRRRILAEAGLTILAGGSAAGQKLVPVSGREDPALASFDEQMLGYLKEQGIPGGALAVTRGGRLVHARGYGWADADTPVQPTDLFRIASVSKPITGIAVLLAVQRRLGGLTLGTHAFPFLGLSGPPPVGQRDARLERVTVAQLLHHTGGWDRDRSGDPMFRHRQIAREMGVGSPPTAGEVVRWMLGRPLDFDPGSRHVYSNFGYCVLGRVLEKATGQPYETWIRRELLNPMGIRRMRIGGGRKEDRLAGEVTYHDPGGQAVLSVHDVDRGARKPSPYAVIAPAEMDAHGGWVASAVDLVRLVAGLDHPAGAPVLTPASRDLLRQRPDPPVGMDATGQPESVYYGLGWNVRTVAGGVNTWHNGAMPGTSALLVRLANGNVWSALFNARGDAADLDRRLHRAAAAVTRWPKGSSFPR